MHGVGSSWRMHGSRVQNLTVQWPSCRIIQLIRAEGTAVPFYKVAQCRSLNISTLPYSKVVSLQHTFTLGQIGFLNRMC